MQSAFVAQPQIFIKISWKTRTNVSYIMSAYNIRNSGINKK